MYTEEEAKTKWCPFARVPLMDNIAGNRMDVTDESSPVPEYGARCIASECMAWRWAETFWRDEAGKTWNSPNRIAKAQPTGSLVKVEHGFCGLAGKPE